MLWRVSVTGGIFLSAWLFIPSLCIAADKGAPVTEPSLDRIEARLDNIERQLQNQGLLDMLQQIQRLQQEVTDLRGQIEVNSHKLGALEDKQRKLYTDIDNRLQRIGQQNSNANNAEAETVEPPPLTTIKPAETAVPAGNEAESSLTVENVATDTQTETTDTQTEPETQAKPDTQAETEIQTEPEPVTTVDTGAETLQPPAATVTEDDALKAQANYQQAFSLLKKADYDQAISAFDTFLRKYPDSQYSDNAQYWMGEAYYVTRRFNEAITEYMKLVTNYPDSQKVPNSLLKIGYSYLELGQRDQARKVLEDLINRYPGTNAAQDAQEKLNKSPTT